MHVEELQLRDRMPQPQVPQLPLSVVPPEHSWVGQLPLVQPQPSPLHVEEVVAPQPQLIGVEAPGVQIGCSVQVPQPPHWQSLPHVRLAVPHDPQPPSCVWPGEQGWYGQLALLQ